jgi:hypothetical protein
VLKYLRWDLVYPIESGKNVWLALILTCPFCKILESHMFEI